MDKRLSLEEQVKALQNNFGAVVNTVKYLKISVDSLKSLVEERKSKRSLKLIELLKK